MAFATFDMQTFIEEAYSRARIPLEFLTVRHNKEALQSLVFINSSWATQGIKMWQLKTAPVTLDAGIPSFTAASDCLSIFSVFRTNNNIDYPMEPITLRDYDMLHDKTMTGTPSVFTYFPPTNTVSVWPACSLDNTTFTYSYVARSADTIIGTDSTNVPYKWWDALVSELAYRLAEKNPKVDYNTVARLEMKAKQAYALAYYDDDMVGQTVTIRPAYEQTGR